MRMFSLAALAAFTWTALVGCAASVSPMPGVELGFDADVDQVGGTVAVNPKDFGCEMAKLISWNAAENALCEPKAPEAPAAPAAPEAL
jgi:hypothetical protein